MTAETDQPTSMKAECSNCGGTRNCEIRGMHRQRGSDGDDYYHWQVKWYILECRGCEHVFAQTVSSNSEDVDYSYGPEGETVSDYREVINTWPAQSRRARPAWMADHGIVVANAHALDAPLLELYGALDADLSTLAAIGMRTAFDVASTLLRIDPGLSFTAKLRELVERRLIGQADRDQLADLVELGNASAHRGLKPTAAHLSTMMDVLEYFIHTAFVAPEENREREERVRKVRGLVPPRAAKSKRPPASPQPDSEIDAVPILPGS